MNCKLCGKPLRQGMLFCEFCGARVEQSPMMNNQVPQQNAPVYGANPNPVQPTYGMGGQSIPVQPTPQPMPSQAPVQPNFGGQTPAEEEIETLFNTQVIPTINQGYTQPQVQPTSNQQPAYGMNGQPVVNQQPTYVMGGQPTPVQPTPQPMYNQVPVQPNYGVNPNQGAFQQNGSVPPVNNNVSYGMNQQMMPRKNSNVVWLIIPFVLLILGVAGYFVYSTFFANSYNFEENFRDYDVTTATTAYSLMLPKKLEPVTGTQYATLKYLDSTIEIMPVNGSYTLDEAVDKVNITMTAIKDSCKTNCSLVGIATTKKVDLGAIKYYYTKQGYEITANGEKKKTQGYYLYLDNTSKNVRIVFYAYYLEDQGELFEGILSNAKNVAESMSQTTASNIGGSNYGVLDNLNNINPSNKGF